MHYISYTYANFSCPYLKIDLYDLYFVPAGPASSKIQN